MDDLASKILRSGVTAPADTDHSVEIEARIGMFRDKRTPSGQSVVRFSPKLPVRKWEQLRKLFEKTIGQPKITRIKTEFYSGVMFRRRTYEHEDGTSESKGEFKIRHDEVNMINDWVRYSISLEVNTVPNIRLSKAAEKITPLVSDMVRYSYELAEFGCTVDMSIFTEQAANAKKRYLVEIELDQKRNFTLESIKGLIKAVQFTVRAYNDSDLYYSLARYNELCVYINMTLYVPNVGHEQKNTNMTDGNILALSNYIDLRILSEARHLSKQDLRIGGVVGTNTVYSITHKTDGDRAIFIISPFGMWIVRPPFSYNLIDTKIALLLDDKELTVLDCELIPEESRLRGAPTTKYWLQILDAMCVGGYPIEGLTQYQRLVIAKAYLDRLQERQNAVKYNMETQDFDITLVNFTEQQYDEKDVIAFPDLLTISWKQVKTFRTPQQMFNHARYFLHRESELPYKTDGLLLTAANHPYRIRIADGEKIDRKQPAILKYKRPELVTIDFLVSITVSPDEDQHLEVVLKVVNDNAKSSQSQIDFTGTMLRPFDINTMFDYSSLPEDADGRISEFAWRYSEPIEGEDPNTGSVGRLTWIKYRDNKSAPNTNRVARDNWKLMIEPITEYMMTGEGIDLMLYYHNMIKRSLLEEANGVLLDFGPGQGGDTGKWANYRTVFGVEPNEQYLPELARRAELRGFTVLYEGQYVPLDKKTLIIINCGAQDTSRVVQTVRKALAPRNIPGTITQVDAIAMMDVGTFFWESPAILRSVVNTIQAVLRPGGKILWKMMDGDAVRERLTPALLPKALWRTQLAYGPFTLYAETNQEPFSDRDVTPGEDLTGRILINITKQHSMVQNQIEYLTRLTDFYQLLGPEYEVVYQKRADQSELAMVFLGSDSFKISSLYLYGVVLRTRMRQ